MQLLITVVESEPPAEEPVLQSTTLESDRFSYFDQTTQLLHTATQQPAATAATAKKQLPSADYQAKDDQWTAFARSMQPFTKLYGAEFGPRLNSLLVELAQVQAELLIYGRVDGEDSPSLRKLGEYFVGYLYFWNLHFQISFHCSELWPTLPIH